MNIDDYIAKESPILYHVYNNNKIRSFQNHLPLFYKVYDVSAIKMYKMANNIGDTICGVFTDTNILRVILMFLNVIKVLLEVSEKQKLENSLNLLIQIQEILNMLEMNLN